jgi:hypothetical protein
MVETDLADRDEPRIVAVLAQSLLETIEVAFGRLGDEQRMDAQCIRQSVFVGQQANGVEVVGRHGRQDDHVDTDAPRSPDHGGTVAVELGRIEVAMGVDPHARMIADPACRPPRNVILWVEQMQTAGL